MAAAIFTLEMLILFGMVPNQWLALTQGTFEWTSQNIAFTLPSWMMLGNEVSVSFAVIKDVVVGGYSATLLGAVAVGAASAGAGSGGNFSSGRSVRVASAWSTETAG